MGCIMIYASDSETSQKTRSLLTTKLENVGFTIVHDLSDRPELLVCIGGDGTFLEAIHAMDFPQIPFLGINTGHLGFFQELEPGGIDEFLYNYTQGKYSIQTLSTVQAVVRCGEKEEILKALNEMYVTGDTTKVSHMNLFIGDSFVERFSGDGILVSSPSGSTAYNYALGGSIVDPRVRVLQVTPIAPMNTTAYRSFTSSILLPPDLSVGVVPEGDRPIRVSFDGYFREYNHVDEVRITYADTHLKLLRFQQYDFWNKVKSKLL